MTALNTVLGALTGPRRLRSALRRKTVAISSMLVALDGPGELRARIPAAVFGGDIFGVMSSQLRDALIVAQSAPVSLAKSERRRLRESPAKSAFDNSQNPFPPISELPKPATQWETFNHESTRTSLAPNATPTEQRYLPQFSLLETQISREGIEENLFNKPKAVLKPPVDLATSSTTKQLSEVSALVSSLNRYWQSVREGHDSSYRRPQPSSDSPADTTSFHVTDSEQHISQRAWPTSVGRDVSEKLRSFTNTTNPLQKQTRLSATPERRIQNVFNIEVNQANQHSDNFDDLGDRIAQILHEQALQHGIDVT